MATNVQRPEAPNQDKSAPNAQLENGRAYSLFREGEYLFPFDESELDRLDIFHKFFIVARAPTSIAGLHQFRLESTPARILDLGCGTGIWAIDMAELYPQANIIGWDLDHSTPEYLPPSIQNFWEQKDMTESNWGVEPGSMDLVHMRLLAGAIRDWRAVYQNVFSALLPEKGWFEHVEIDFRPVCRDGSLPAQSSLRRWADELYDAFQQFGKPFIVTPLPEVLMHEIGFTDVRHDAVEVPFHPWPADEHKKDMGRWFNLALSNSLEAMSYAPMIRIQGRQKAEVDALLAAVRDEITTRSIRASCVLHVWTARRPGRSQ